MYLWLSHLQILPQLCKHLLNRVIHIVALIQSLSRVQLFETLWTTAREASLSFTISQVISLKDTPLAYLCQYNYIFSKGLDRCPREDFQFST